MSQGKRGILILALAGLLAGLTACGSGGSSTSGDTLPQASAPPVVVLGGWTPSDAQLSQYKAYTFNATATDPNIGGSITEFHWDFGDGTTRVVPSTLVAGKPTSSLVYAYSTSGSPTLSVVAKNASGLLSTADTRSLTVNAAVSPLTATFTAPAAPITINPALGGTYPLTFNVHVANTGTGTISPAGVVLTSNDTGATVATPVDLGGGNWQIIVTYHAAAAVGSRTATPSVTVTDSNGVSSPAATGPVITIKTVSLVNSAPQINVTTPATPTSTAWSSKAVTLEYTLTDQDGDPLTYSVDWGDGTTLVTGSTTTDTKVGQDILLTHAFSDSWALSHASSTVTVTADDGRATAHVNLTFNLTFNAFPTANIISPQGSGTLPASVPGVAIPPGTTDPDVIVIPLGGKLIFDGTSTVPGSGDAATYTWTFPGGQPQTSSDLHPGQVSFQGTQGVIQANLVTFVATDPFGRTSKDIQDHGSATGGTTTTLVDSTKRWAVNQWAGVYVRIRPGTGGEQFRLIASNTATTLTWATAATAPAAGTAYQIEINPKTYKKWVLVDGTQTQNFNLSFLYRLRSDMNSADTFDYVRTTANGMGVNIQIFQDGLSNQYSVTDSTKALVSIPVRSNLPFWVSIPKFGSDFGYIFRIPNQPGVDPSLGDTAPDISKGTLFGFASHVAPYNPTLQIVTAAGFAAENAPSDQRRFQGSIDLYNDVTCDAKYQPNLRWLDRLSVPIGDPLGSNDIFIQSSNNIGAFSGLKGYQSFGEWWMSLKAGETRDFNTYKYFYDTTSTTPEDRRKGATGNLQTVASPNDMGFVIDSGKYNVDGQSTEHFSIFGIQAYRAPASSNDPYDFDAVANRLPNSRLNDTVPTPLDPLATAFIQQLITAGPGTQALKGGLNSIPVPYNANDIDRKPYNPTVNSPYTHYTSFSYAEYLWSKAFARPLVLNRTSASAFDTDAAQLSTVSTGRITIPCSNPATDVDVVLPKFFYCNPAAAWPKLSSIFPDNSAFNLSVTEAGTFDASSSPVAVGGGVPGVKGVGRFFWTAFNCNFNAAPGGLISRTWQGNGAYHFPIAFAGATTTDPLTAWGFLPPQDTMVDKRARDANGKLTGANLGGYRIQWYNPTVDASAAGPKGNVVAPDFWVVEVSANGTVSHFLLPGGYPAGAGNQSVTDSIMTDARKFLPSGNDPAVGAKADGTDVAAPGYCWFDVPPELRPQAGSSATITVYALRSVLKTQAGYRAINRTEWIESIKTATASISVKPTGVDVSQGHKVPFNYSWDVVVVNGPATPVAP